MLEKNPKTRDDRQVLLACRFLFLKGSIQLKTPPRQSVEVRPGCPVHAGGYLQSASCRGRGYLGVLRSRHSCAFHRGPGAKVGWLVGQRTPKVGRSGTLRPFSANRHRSQWRKRCLKAFIEINKICIFFTIPCCISLVSSLPLITPRKYVVCFKNALKFDDFCSLKVVAY